MSPLAFLGLAVGVPLLIGVFVSFVRGSASLRRYLTIRILLTIPMVLILGTVIFVVMRIIPGDPVDSELFLRLNPAEREEVREDLGLNDPILVQYGRFLVEIATLDFGNSLVGARRPVIDEIEERLPATVELVVPAAFAALAIGTLLGAEAATRRRKPSDLLARVISVVATSLPIFWLALLLQLWLAVGLGWFPVAGRIDPIVGTTLERTTNLLVIDSILGQNWPALRSALSHLVLPVTTVTIILAGLYLRLTRINMIDVMHQDYMTAARARGIGRNRTVYRYGLRNASLPVLTVFGLQFAILLGGAVLTETVFSWPGMGRYVVERISLRDFTAVQSSIVMFALIVAVASLIVDLIYSVLDPRVRF